MVKERQLKESAGAVSGLVGLEVSIGEDSNTKASPQFSGRTPGGDAGGRTTYPRGGRRPRDSALPRRSLGAKRGTKSETRFASRCRECYKSYSHVDSHSRPMIMNVIQVSLSINKEAIFIFL